MNVNKTLSPLTQRPKSEKPLPKASSSAHPVLAKDSVSVSQASPLKIPKTKAPTLERPVVFVHGFNGTAEKWGEFSSWMATGDGNKDGGIVQADRLVALDPSANLFTVRFSRPYNSVESNKAELKQIVEAISKATGSEEIDLVVHSLGGLGARHYLQDDEERVNKLVLLGTPNQGSQLANLEKYFRKNFNFPILPPVDDDEVRRVLDQLSVDKNDKDGNPENPWLRELNQDWENQRDRADMMVIASAGIPTLTGGPGITIFGDGVVTRKSAKLSGVPHKTTWFKFHTDMHTSSKIMKNTARFLTGQDIDESDFLAEVDGQVQYPALSPTPQVDKLEKVDSQRAKKAHRLPLLDPAFQIGLALGVLSSVMGGPKEMLPFVEIGLDSDSQESRVRADYTVDLMKDSNQLTGGGEVDGDPFTEVANFHEGKVHWQSATGVQASGLTIEVGEDEKSVTMKGTMGGVPTDLKLDLTFDKEGQMDGLRTVGTFNGEPYAVRSKIDMPSLLLHHHGEMEIRGLANNEEVDRSYDVDVVSRENGLEFMAQSSKQVDGLSSDSVDVNVRVLNRD